MTRSRPYEKRSRNDREAWKYDSLEGTSARTRPFSFDEIMQRRQNREDAANQVGNDCGVAQKTSSRDGPEKVSSFFDHRLLNDSSGPNDMNHTSNDPRKGSLQRKEDSYKSRKDKKLVQDNCKGSQNTGSEFRRTEDNDVNSNRITEARDEKHHRSDWRKHDDSDYGASKRKASDSDKKEKVSERCRIRSEITRPEDYSDDRIVDRKRKNEKQINDDYKGRYEKDAIKTDNLVGRGGNKSNITRPEDYRDHRRVDRKRKNDEQINNNYECEERDEKDAIKTEKLTSRVGYKSEDCRDHRLVDRKRENDERINNNYEYEKRDDKDAIKADKLTSRGGDKLEIAKPEDYRDHRLVDRKRKNDERINNNYEYEKRNEKDVSKTDKLTSRGGDKSEITTLEDYRDHRLVDRKRKNDEKINHNHEYEKRNEKDAIKTDKLTSRGGDKAEKENKHKRHAKEEDKARGISSVKKSNDSDNKESEPARPYFEVSRPKRRHSHSRERHAKDRGRRSRSHSPKAHKHTPKERKELVEISSHSTKDKSEREPSDVDQKRTSHNESSSHYRRNTGPSSGLGGYSPRKRKTGAGLKTPSPTRRSPERRTAGWDLQPVENMGIVAASAPANLQPTNQTFSWKINETSSITTPVAPLSVKPIANTYQNLVSQMQAIESVQLTEATRPMRRLYVENVPASVSDKHLIECINRYLLASGTNHIQGTQPCISCIIHREKAQALLEFLTPEDASAAVSLDTISFSGSSLKLRRPKDYSAATGNLEKSVVAAGSPCGVVEDSPYKIFIGEIPKLISSTMLLEIARTFGAVKAYHYEFNTDMNESYAFLEYVDHSVSPKACAGLNGIRLGGQVITAVFASRDAASENTGKVPCYGIPEHAKPLLEKPTAVLKLKNVLDPGSLSSLSELEMNEILEDVRLECSRFGMVKSVNVSKQNNSSVTSEACEGKDTNASIDERMLNKSGGTLHESEEQPLEAVNESNRHLLDNRSEVVGCSSYDEDIEEKFGGITREMTSQCNAPVNELESNKNISGAGATPRSNTESGNKSLTGGGEDSKFKESNNPEVVSPSDVKIDGNAPEEGDKEDISTDIFEPGSVFVEFKRPEGACVAAHSLHGRIFDGRSVTVEYVDQDRYKSRFQG